MLFQTNGWLLYLIALVSAQSKNTLLTTTLAPVGTCGAICIALSVYFHEDMEKKEQEGQPVAWYVTSLALVVVLVMWLDLTTAQLATLGMSLHFIALIGGLHLMWTHFWLISAVLAFFMDNELLLTIFMVTGVSLSIPWYIIAAIDFKSFIGFRAMAGWSLFIGANYQELVQLQPSLGPGKEGFKGPLHHLNSKLDKFLCYSGFWCIDIINHLIPSLLLLRYLNNLSLTAIGCALLLGQGWRRWVSFHHLTPDWKLFLSSFRVKWRRRKHSDHYTLGGIDIDAFSDIYGFKNTDWPHDPVELMDFLIRTENAVYVLALATWAFAPSTTLVSVAEYSSLLASFLIKISAVSAILGPFALFSTAIRGWLSVKDVDSGRTTERESH